MKAAIEELENAGIVHIYQVGNQSYYYLTQWNRWQHLRSPRPSEFRAPPTSIIINTSATHALEDEDEKNQNLKGQVRSDEDERSAAHHSTSLNNISGVVTNIANLLGLKSSPALVRLVREYQHDKRVDILVQTDWIDGQGSKSKANLAKPTLSLQSPCPYCNRKGNRGPPCTKCFSLPPTIAASESPLNALQGYSRRAPKSG